MSKCWFCRYFYLDSSPLQASTFALLCHERLCSLNIAITVFLIHFQHLVNRCRCVLRFCLTGTTLLSESVTDKTAAVVQAASLLANT